MKAGISFMRHHLLKAAVSIAVASMVANDIRGRSWLLDLGSTIGLVVTLVLFLGAFGHARKADTCERCVPKSAATLKRPLYRWWKKYSNRGVLPTLVALIAIAVVVPLAFERGVDREMQFNWGPCLSIIAMFLIVAFHIATMRFRQANYPAAGTWNPVRSFIDGDRRGRWLRHNGHWVVIGMILIVAALSFAPMSGVWGAVQSFAFIGFLLSAYANHRHCMSLCEQCAAEFRTDAPEYAAQHMRRFRMVHRYGWFPAVTTLALMTSDTFIDTPYSMHFFPASFVIIGCFTLLERFHCSYQPWCPYCHGGGGGGDCMETAPEPSGGHGKPLPVA